jgi:hypothetical protein
MVKGNLVAVLVVVLRPSLAVYLHPHLQRPRCAQEREVIIAAKLELLRQGGAPDHASSRGSWLPPPASAG